MIVRVLKRQYRAYNVCPKLHGRVTSFLMRHCSKRGKLNTCYTIYHITDTDYMMLKLQEPELEDILEEQL